MAAALVGLAGCDGPTVGEAHDVGGGSGGAAGGGGSARGGTGGSGGGGAAGKSGAGGTTGAGGATGGAGKAGGGTGGTSGGAGGSSVAGAGGSSRDGGAIGGAAGGGGTGGPPDAGTSGDGGPDGGNPDIVWQYLLPPGQLCGAVAVDSKRVIHVVGGTTAGLQVRFDENGTLLGTDVDPLAGTSYGSVAIDAADNVYFAGSIGAGASAQGFIRWGGVGGTTWGHTETYEMSNSWFGDPRLDSQGRIVVIGTVGTYNTPSNHLVLRRYLPAGGYDLDKIDSTVADWATGLALDAQDNIYVSGRDHIVSAGSVVGSTAFLTSWTAGGASGFTDTIANKSTCVSSLDYTNSYGVTFDGAGGLWLLGLHCDNERILRRYDPATGALTLNADFTPADDLFPQGIASDGTTLTLVGQGSLPGVDSVGAFALLDTDLQGKPLRAFDYAFATTNESDYLLDVAFIDRDRIVVGTTNSGTGNRTWIARLRAP